MSAIDYPDKIELAHLPTPLQRLERTGADLGVELYIKRDDLTGTALSGNKIRKLEFLLADALARGADTVITCGGEQSNHCRATAVAAARCGLRAVLLLRTADPQNPPPTAGNILLDWLVGADIVWIGMADWKRRNELLAEQAAKLQAQGRTPYIIPEGGSNPLGSWGYVAAMDELAGQLAALPARPTTIVYPCGSGGTGAGLVLGARILGLGDQGVRVTGICVCDNRDYFVREISRICAEFAGQFGAGAGVSADDIDIIDDYVGLGYGRSRPEELARLRDLARREGIIVDPVYTGKAFHGLVEEIVREHATGEQGRFGERVVFVHTGGIYRLFSDQTIMDG